MAATAIGVGICSTACGSTPEHEEATDNVAQPVLGDVATWGPTCNASYQNVIRKALWFGRVAANSNAFQQCMTRAMQTGFEGKGPYKKCRDEPFGSDPIATQITKAVAIGRGANTWNIACDGASNGAFGQAGIGSYGLTGPEEIKFGIQFQRTAQKAESALAVGLAPYPLLAEALWHEAYHQHGYDHGASDSEDAAQVARENARYCGQQNDATYHYQVNSLPYIAGRCIGLVLEKGEAACGIPDRCPVGTSLMLPTSIDSTTCACVADPSPNVPRPVSDDSDHDGVPNAKDNCRYTWNPLQENCNAEAENARLADSVGDACDPVPCASAETSSHLNAVSCVPNPPPAQGSQACSGTREENELVVAALGPHLRGGGPYRRKISSGVAYSLPTEFRFCQNNLDQNRKCDRNSVIADDQLAYYASAEAEQFNDDHPWHRVTMQNRTRGDTIAWDYGSSGGYASQSRTWLYDQDLPFWLGRPTGPTIWTPANNPGCTVGAGNCLDGIFWLHTNTNLGVSSAVINSVDYGAHGAQLANEYFPIKPSQGNIGWCPIPSPFALPGAKMVVSTASTNLGLSPLLTQSSLLWRDTGTRRRIDLRPLADTELIVSTTSLDTNIFAALQDVGSAIALQGSQLSQDCGGDSMTTGLASALRTVPHWLSAVEPDARIGALGSDVMAVALSARHRSIVDAALVSNDTLISTAELPPLQAAAPSTQSASVASVQASTVASADDIVGGGLLPSDRDGWLPIFSRAAEGVFLVGSTPSELWFKQLGASHSWTALNANVLPAGGTVLAATYSFRDKHIWMLHQAPDDAAVCLMQFDPWDSSPTGVTRRKLGCWNYSGLDVYLTVDREGDVLVTTSGDLGAGPVTATARIDFDAQQEPYISGTTVNPGILAYPPIVSRRSYAFVVQDGTSFTTHRQTELTATTSPLSSFQTYMGKTCGNLSISGSLASPQPAGAAITFTAGSTCDSGVAAEYRFWRKDAGHASTLVQDWGGSTYAWNTAGLDAGDYSIRVESRRTGSKAEFDASATVAYSITAPTGRCGELTSWLTQGVIAPAGQIQVNATATCSQAAIPEYRVEATGPDGTEYLLQNWAPTVASSFASPSTTLGQYVVKVLARRQGSSADYQSRSILGLTVRRGTCETVTAIGPDVAYAGYTSQLSGQATCSLGAAPQYRFLVTKVSTGQTTLIRDWSPAASMNWVPSGFAYGSYVQRVEARRYGATGDYEGVGTRSFKICSAAGGVCP